MGGYRYGGFAPYVPVAKRRERAAKKIAKLQKKGQKLQPVVLEGSRIAQSFWGKAWCKHLETFSDYENRLPRGRSYVRHGAVMDLQLQAGIVKALVDGSSVYKIEITMAAIHPDKWQRLISDCAGKIESVIELLQGKLSKSVMEVITHPEKGLFPKPKELSLACSCPDGARLCKHLAAVLYGVGARLDERPEDLFLLRRADHMALLAAASGTVTAWTASDTDQALPGDLSSLFGIELESGHTADTAGAALGGAQKSRAAASKKPLKRLPKPKPEKKSAPLESSAQSTPKRTRKDAKPVQSPRQTAKRQPKTSGPKLGRLQKHIP